MKSSQDRNMLAAVFGGDCMRISRINAVLEAVKMSEMNAADQRLAGARGQCDSVEKVLEDMGLGLALRQALDKQKQKLKSKRVEVSASEVEELAASAGVVEAA